MGIGNGDISTINNKVTAFMNSDSTGLVFEAELKNIQDDLDAFDKDIASKTDAVIAKIQDNEKKINKCKGVQYDFINGNEYVTSVTADNDTTANYNTQYCKNIILVVATILFLIGEIVLLRR